MFARSGRPRSWLRSLAPDDGHLELILVRGEERDALMDYLGRRLQSRHEVSFGLPALRFRNLKIAFRKTPFRIDSGLWPEKGTKSGRSTRVEISVKPSALIISRPMEDSDTTASSRRDRDTFRSLPLASFLWE